MRVILLCEDRMQEQFLSALCKEQGWFILRRYVAPSGTGAASAWVREQYAEVVRRRRAASDQAHQALLVAIDGDNHGPAARLEQMDGSLGRSGQAPRASAERIAVLVPTWSIETWLLFLHHGLVVPESSKSKEHPDLKPLRAADWRCLKRDAMEAIIASWRRGKTTEHLPSLQAGYVELARIAG